MQKCSRCDVTNPSVEIRLDCEECGPTFLCDNCHKTHVQENLEDSQYGS